MDSISIAHTILPVSSPLLVREVKSKGRKQGGEKRAGCLQCHEKYQRPDPLFLCRGELLAAPPCINRDRDIILVPSADVLSNFGCFLVPLLETATDFFIVYLQSVLEKAFYSMQRNAEHKAERDV